MIRPARSAPIRIVLAALIAAFPTGALADAPAQPSGAAPADALDAYVHARAADDLGQLQLAAESYASAAAADPGDAALGVRTYRQAVRAGDMALALATAEALDKAQALPPDGTLLLLAAAVQRRNWKRADALADRVASEKIFVFLVPVLHAWIAYGRRRDALAPLANAATVSPFAGAYAAEHRALLLIATGHEAEGAAAITALGDPASARAARLRIAAAASLQDRRQPQAALALLTGDQPAIARARAALEAGKALPGAVDTPASGVAELYARVAADLNHQETAPLALGFARMAAMLAPDDSEAWLLSATLLANDADDQAALAALAHVAPGDPFIGAARDERVLLLKRDGRTDEALAEASAAARDPGALPPDWARLGDLLTDARRYPEAAQAYGQALALAGGDRAPAEVAWPLLLEQGNALLQQGDWPAAKAALDRSLALAPNQPAVLNFLGYSELQRHEDVPAAAALIAKASTLAPDDPAITDSLGWSWYLRGDVARALPLLQAAAHGAPSDSEINEHLGDALWKVGRRLEARYAWRAALVVADPADVERLKAKIGGGPGAVRP